MKILNWDMGYGPVTKINAMQYNAKNSFQTNAKTNTGCDGSLESLSKTLIYFWKDWWYFMGQWMHQYPGASDFFFQDVISESTTVIFLCEFLIPQIPFFPIFPIFSHAPKAAQFLFIFTVRRN